MNAERILNFQLRSNISLKNPLLSVFVIFAFLGKTNSLITFFIMLVVSQFFFRSTSGTVN